jgi:hypothetical protein
VVQLADGRKARVYAAGLIRRTQHENIGFAADDRVGIGMVFDLENGIRMANERRAMNSDRLELGEPYLTPVYHFEVDGFHTYYVGDAGVWVHNADCNKTEAARAAVIRASIPNARLCFHPDTYVVTYPGILLEIKYLKVGDLVLSRCEKTGRQGYRRILKTFEHARCEETVYVGLMPVKGDGGKEWGKDDERRICTTVEHPFWVEGMGWVPAGELRAGQKLLIVDPIGQLTESEKFGCLKDSGRLVPAVITQTERVSNIDDEYDENGNPFYLHSVLNLEVEEFHTYFVGSYGVWVHDCAAHNESIEPLRIQDETAPKNDVKGYRDNPADYNSEKGADTQAQNEMLDAIAHLGFEVIGLEEKNGGNTIGLNKNSSDQFEKK